MNFKPAVTQSLLGFTALRAIVGDRITWGLRERDAATPALVLTLVAQTPQYMMREREGLIPRLLQLDGWAQTPDEAQDIADAVLAWTDALNAAAAAPILAALIEQVRDGTEAGDAAQPDGGRDLFRTSTDVRVWFRDP